MEKLLVIFRYFFCLLGAGALLYTFSYPDTLVPPNPYWEEATGISLYSLKPLIWLIPVLFMEMVSCVGPRRNLVWFGSLFTVLAAALLVYPVLQAYAPEYVHPTFNYQGGMLSTGLIYYVSFVGISLAIRLVILAYMFPPEELQEQLEVGFVSASALSPENARSLKEIAAEKKVVSHRFIFKKGDARAALRFQLIMKRLILRSKIITYTVIAGVLTLLLWFFLFPQPSDTEAMQRDMQTMLKYRVNMHGQVLATNAAVHAAARVMKRISDEESLAGMSREEAEKWLGIDQVPEAYRSWLRDERDIKIASTNSTYENRTRFLTITNGRQICVLYIRTNPADESIIVAELQDAGWDAVADEQRRRIGTDWGALYH